MQGKGINRAQTPFLYLSSPEWRHAEWTERMPRGKKRKEEKEVCQSGLFKTLLSKERSRVRVFPKQFILVNKLCKIKIVNIKEEGKENK